jgi:phospholipid/cholesterol/gamma-HCH transport system substrate-binding protein
MTAIRAGLRRYGLAAFLAGLVILAIVLWRVIAGASEYRLEFRVDSANGLYPGSDVLVAGAKAGSVQDITVDGGRAQVTIAVDQAHAPVHKDARVAVRPKSLLGEKYVQLEPGSDDTLPAGSELPASQVLPPVELQDVVNSLDAPTREKLRTLVIELGGGVTGQGASTNQTLYYGRQDLDDLAAVADTLAARDQDLQAIVQALDQVTAELARSDRSHELGGLVQNSQALLHSLTTQDAQIRNLLVQANAALGRTDRGLQGTASDLNAIFQQAPALVSVVDRLTADLGAGMDTTLSGNHLEEHDKSTRATTVVFGSRDANGYATRVKIIPCTTCPYVVPGGTSSGAAISHSGFDDVVGLILQGVRQ